MQESIPSKEQRKEFPIENPFAGTVNIPTPGPIIVVSTAVAVTGVLSAVWANKP